MSKADHGWSRLLCLAFTVLIAGTAIGCADVQQDAPGPRWNADGEWRFLGGDAWHTRYTSAAEIDVSNFESLDVAWQFDAADYGPSTPRSTPSYVDGKLITVTGERLDLFEVRLTPMGPTTKPSRLRVSSETHLRL